jgi:predicted acylesterase/phospholipase RssA
MEREFTQNGESPLLLCDICDDDGLVREKYLPPSFTALRRSEQPVITLVTGSGGTKALEALGFWAALHAAGLFPDNNYFLPESSLQVAFVGTSAGAFLAAALAKGFTPEQLIYEVTRKEYNIFDILSINPTFSNGTGPGIGNLSGLRDIVVDLLGGDLTYDDLVHPCATVLSLHNGHSELAVAMGRSNVATSVQASCSFRGISPVEIEGEGFRDGAFADGGRTPIGVARSLIGQNQVILALHLNEQPLRGDALEAIVLSPHLGRRNRLLGFIDACKFIPKEYIKKGFGFLTLDMLRQIAFSFRRDELEVVDTYKAWINVLEYGNGVFKKLLEKID